MARNWMSTTSQPLGRSMSASADNAAADQRQNAWNTAAASQYQQLRQQQLGDQTTKDSISINNETNRQLLAKALNYPVNNSPSFPQLYAKFTSLPDEQKVGIYKKGLAPWLDYGGEDKTGSDLIQHVQDNLQKERSSIQSEITKDLANGKIGFDEKDEKGNPKWWRLQDIPSPQGPMFPNVLAKVPLNPVATHFLGDAVNKGIIPNPETGIMATEAPDAAAKPQMTTDQFQQVLNARQGKPDTIDTFQQVLNQRAGLSQAQTIAQAGNYQTPSAQSSFSSVDPARLANAQPEDPFVAAHNYLASPKLGTDLSNTSQAVVTTGNNVMDAIGAAGSVVANMVPRFYNAAGRLIFGANSPQIPTITPQSQQPAIDPQTTQQDSIIQALRAQNPDAPMYDAQKQLGY